MTATGAIVSNQTPDLADVFDVALRRMALRLRVSMPAKVVRVLGPQFVNLQPLWQHNVDGVLHDYPPVNGALVCMPLGADAQFTWALQPGDTGVLLCADRSLDAYAASDGTKPVDPANARCHELTDAIFVPGLVPHGKQSAPTQDMVLRNGAMVARLQKSGQLVLSNGRDELVTLLAKMAQQLATLANSLVAAQVMTTTGPAPFIAPSIQQFQQTATTMVDVASRITGMKGS